ncbi:putative aminoacyl-tRNA hydrolase [Ostertagia ostertagi]
MVLVANMSLKMGTGKLAAQVGHATLGVYRQAMNSEAGREAVEAWTRRMGRVVLSLCNNAGYTQIPPGSRTVLGIFGTVEQVDAVTGGLKLL